MNIEKPLLAMEVNASIPHKIPATEGAVLPHEFQGFHMPFILWLFLFGRTAGYAPGLTGRPLKASPCIFQMKISPYLENV